MRARKRPTAIVHDNGAVTLERLERALFVVAYIVKRHGEVYAPILDRLDREVKMAKRNARKGKADRILMRYRKKFGKEFDTL
jgi:hypothetical protein